MVFEVSDFEVRQEILPTYVSSIKKVLYNYLEIFLYCDKKKLCVTVVNAKLDALSL